MIAMSTLLKDPLPTEALQFARIVYEVCGEACLSGSAPLTKHLLNLFQENCSGGLSGVIDRCKSNDIDIFAPMYPARLERSRELERRGIITPNMSDSELAKARYHFIPKENNQFNLHTCLVMLLLRHGVGTCEINVRELNRLGIEHDCYGAWSDATSFGVNSIIDLKLIKKDGAILDASIQLILIDAYPRPLQEWHKFVTDRFDINIARGIARIDCASRLGQLVFDENDLRSLEDGKFTFVIRNCVPFKVVLRRIQKYRKKGFMLEKLCFSKSCSAEYREHIVKRFCHLQGPQILMGALQNAGVNSELSMMILDKVFLPFLKLPDNNEKCLIESQLRLHEKPYRNVR